MPDVGRTSPHAIFTSVDLPAPFGPEQADELALPHLEIYPLERLHLPVALGQCLGGERSSHVASVGTALVPEEG